MLEIAAKQFPVFLACCLVKQGSHMPDSFRRYNEPNTILCAFELATINLASATFPNPEILSNLPKVVASFFCALSSVFKSLEKDSIIWPACTV